MPGDEIHYKALQGLCDNPLRATSFLFVGEKGETVSRIFHHAVIHHSHLFLGKTSSSSQATISSIKATFEMTKHKNSGIAKLV